MKKRWIVRWRWNVWAIPLGVIVTAVSCRMRIGPLEIGYRRPAEVRDWPPHFELTRPFGTFRVSCLHELN
jgi:hypothetical protein